ncbi:heme-binding protein [Psychromonas sp. psych-6C06]|uniref:SOUL family heme-binding protein n=1 Tax=Psychromonas sp. psych-6C06 TaxID=2058089 RepID=UPI000C3332FE|nr:heme-binding protein [Psychromonas sp. psych-6C06]PKF63543.1 heme-binding protein [Psychromonas sp. psych-6C06]
MKHFKVIITCSLMLLISGKIMATEEIKYQTLTQQDNFELRLYEPYLIAEVIVDTEFDEAGSDAFKPLFKYISGDNKSQQDIAMTAPVSQEASGEKISMTSPVEQQKSADKWAVSFMIPDKYTPETVPEPTNTNVTIREVPARYIASITYSGFWSESGYQTHYKKLQQWMDDAGYKVVGEAIWARYDPPFKPWFLRRNEILIPIEKPSI